MEEFFTLNPNHEIEMHKMVPGTPAYARVPGTMLLQDLR